MIGKHIVCCSSQQGLTVRLAAHSTQKIRAVPEPYGKKESSYNELCEGACLKVKGRSGKKSFAHSVLCMPTFRLFRPFKVALVLLTGGSARRQVPQVDKSIRGCGEDE